VLRLLDNPEERLRIAAAARRFAETAFDDETNHAVLGRVLLPGTAVSGAPAPREEVSP
jgi:hypothetical protein